MGIDLTPLMSAHRIRGIGRYLEGMVGALGASDPGWTASQVGLLLSGGQEPPVEPARAWRTTRSRWRPQDFDPAVAILADRLAIRGSRPRLWHHTDPTIPDSPLPSGRTLVTVYDLIPLQVPEVMAGIRPHRRWVYRRYLDSIRRARGVIAISETTREAVIHLLDVDRQRIHVVTPSIELDPSTLTDDERPPPGDLSLLFVGVPDPHKRPELAIDTVAELVRRGRDPRLTMVGHHPAPARARLVGRALAAGIGDRVRFLDRIDDRALVSLYRSSITLALSSVEGFGLPPVESVLAGGRVVATPIDAYRETLTAHAEIAAAADPIAIADAVERARLRDPAASDLAALAQRFSPGAAATALRLAYEELGAH